MARNGSGTYSLPLADVVAGNTILASWANTTLTDIETALTASLAKDGQTNPTANLPMNSFRHTGVGQGAALTDYVRCDQIVDGDLLALTAVAGTDTITATGPLSVAAYVTNMHFIFIAAGTNTGATTLNINGIGAKTVQYAGAALEAGDIVSGRAYLVVYDGTNFQLLNGSTFADSGIDEIAALSPTDSYFIVGNGSSWVTETGATVRTSLGLGTGDSPQFTGLTLTGLATLVNATLSGTLIQKQGADVASAASLSLGAGNLFDVTGTTAITSIATKGVGSVVVLQFDAALTLTHHATDLILPSGANITTAAGDIAVFYEYATGDWRCISYSRKSGAPLVSSSGAWEEVSQITLSSDATADFDNVFDGTYDMYRFVFDGVLPATDNVQFECLVAHDATPTYETSSYRWAAQTVGHNTADSWDGDNSLDTAQIVMALGCGNASTEGLCGTLQMFDPTNASQYNRLIYTTAYHNSVGGFRMYVGGGGHLSASAVTSIRFKYAAGNIASGTITLLGRRV